MQSNLSRQRLNNLCRLRLWIIGFAVVAASAFTLPAFAAPNAETGTIGLRLLEQPDDTTDNPRAAIYIIDHLAPGTQIQRRVEVSTTNTAAPVHLYAAAATITDSAFLGAPGETANDLSTWTSVTPGDIDIESNQVATATVTITVPTDARLRATTGSSKSTASASASTSPSDPAAHPQPTLRSHHWQQAEHPTAHERWSPTSPTPAAAPSTSPEPST
jgi:hypothetical protein